MIVDAIMALVVLEAVALLAWHRRTGRGIAAAALLPNLAAGFCLLAALRLGLAGAAWHWVALALFGSLLAHLLDLRGRWDSP